MVVRALSAVLCLVCVSLVSAQSATLEDAERLMERCRELRVEKDYVLWIDHAVRALSLRRQELGDDHPETAKAWYETAAAFSKVAGRTQVDGLFKVARDKLHRALSPDDPWVLRAEADWVTVLKNSSRREEAVRVGERALSRGGEPRGARAPALAAVHNALGHAYRASVKHAEAEVQFRRALALYDAHIEDAPLDAVACYTWFAWHLSRQGRNTEAWEVVQKAARSSQELLPPDHQLRLEVAGIAHMVALALGQHDLADSLWTYKSLHPLDPAQQPVTLDALGRGNPQRLPLDRAPTVDEWETYAAQEEYLNTSLATLHAVGREQGGALDRARRDLDAAWDRLEAAGEAEDQAGAWFAVVEAESRRLAAVRSLLQRHRNGSQGLLQRAQQALDSDSALIGFVGTQPFHTPHQVCWAYVIRDSGPIAWRKVEESFGPGAWWAPLRNLHEELGAAARWPERVPLDGEVRRLSRRAGRVFWDVLEEPLRGVKHIIVTGNDIPPMPGLPLESLADSSGTFLVDRFAVSYTPSVPFWLMTRRDQDPPQSCLVVGDPASHGGYAPLPHAAREAEDVAAAFQDAHVLVEEKVTKEILESRIRERDYDVIHVAAHAEVDALDISSSALVLAPGESSRGRSASMLTAREIFLSWDLDAGLVTLSGCRTQHARGVDSRAFQAALVRAGAQSLLASLWPVDDEATALLMKHFYALWTGGLAKARALQQAKILVREYRAPDGSRPFEHPVYWAGFVLTG